MKIISIFYTIALLLMTMGFIKSTENKVKSQASSQSSTKSNSGIFESISKYKLKNKSKSHAKAKTLASKEDNKIPIEVSPKPALSVDTLSDNKQDGGFLEKPTRKGPLLWNGWVKFYVYKTSDQSSLLKGLKKYKYYKNNEYNEQQKRSMSLNLDEKIEDEYKYVHDPYNFWISVFPNNINFSNSRIVSLSFNKFLILLSIVINYYLN